VSGTHFACVLEMLERSGARTEGAEAGGAVPVLQVGLVYLNLFMLFTFICNWKLGCSSSGEALQSRQYGGPASLVQ